MAKLRIFELSLISSRSGTATFAPISRLKSTYVIFFFFCVGLTIAPAQSFTSLLSFDGSNGAFPQGFLVEGTHGKLYGTTPYGGAYGGGTVFEITSDGKVTTLHSFDGFDGGAPYAGLIRSRTGNLYGVSSGDGFGAAYGTVFEITPTGELTTLYTFCSQPNCTDGSTPFAGLVQGSNGNFYGVTYKGGANGDGTIFEITPTGKLTTLYSFCSETNCTDGEAPLLASLVEGSNGNFYGTTPTGGAYGWGTVFEITPSGKLRTLYSFCRQPNCTDGGIAYAGLVQGRNGNLYGTTFGGGAHGYGGTVFEITPKGKLTTLYSFCSQPNCSDGTAPYAGLAQGSNGKFYGTTVWGGVYGASDCGVYGNSGCGTLFRLAEKPPFRKTFAERIGGDK